MNSQTLLTPSTCASPALMFSGTKSQSPRSHLPLAFAFRLLCRRFLSRSSGPFVLSSTLPKSWQPSASSPSALPATAAAKQLASGASLYATPIDTAPPKASAVTTCGVELEPTASRRPWPFGAATQTFPLCSLAAVAAKSMDGANNEGSIPRMSLGTKYCGANNGGCTPAPSPWPSESPGAWTCTPGGGLSLYFVLDASSASFKVYAHVGSGNIALDPECGAMT
mmetsp:Transcript_111918/g.316265  ORF Transcript_111918/g.316265 Transcript_111918/m.316265 type:complete len:224 (+) Transcript_111918:660-1331(+)